jgi:hypothetical protein
MNAADVKSIESLHDLHAAIAKFRTEAQDAIASVDLTVRRGHDYLSDQLRFWQAAIRTTEDEVFQAKQELNQRKYVGFDGREPDTTVQEAALRRAKAKLQHAHDKVDKVRQWQRKLPHAVSETWDGPGRQLAALLEAELPRGLALLERRIISLEQYAALMPPTTGPAAGSAPASAEPTTETPS